MSPKALEALKHNPSIADLDIDGLVAAASTTHLLYRPESGRWEHRDLAKDNFNLLIYRHGQEIGRASVDNIIDISEHGEMLVAIIEEFSLSDSYNNHSAYLALLQQIDGRHRDIIAGMPSNEMTAVALDLDTFSLLPSGLRARYYRNRGAELVELQYPNEIYENIGSGEPVYHIFERAEWDDPHTSLDSIVL